MVLGRSRGYLETAYQEVPLILSGASQTVASNFNLHTESINQVYNLPLDEDLTSDGLYMLTEHSVYRSIDYQYLEEYGTLAHTNSLIGMFRASIDNDNYVIGTSGVYCYKDKEWQLAWNQPNVLNVEQVSPTQYFVRKPTEVGLVNHLLPDQKFLPTVSGLPSNTSGTTGVELIKNGNFLSVLN